MKQLNSVIKSINNKTLQGLAEALTNAAVLHGKIQALEAILKAERAKANGMPLPNSADLLRIDLERLQQQYEAEQGKAVKAAALASVESLAKDAGAKNPHLVALALQDKVKAKVDEAGNIKVQVVSEGDELPQYNPRTGSPYTAAEYIESMKVSSEYANLFGEGKPDGYSALSNPWKKETFNLTQQGMISRSNPSLAAKMRAEADIR